ncbi:hypothetical protein VE03_05857 [Pseudogymnoascus sp. 23342-1-I1]|nr:hypothetical protein VE03_05857 [Pseudogymnoascus sp. 23342-1-I1]
MDPLSIAASVVALCTAGDAAYKIASSLYRSSRKVKGAGDDIEIFANDVDNYGVAMGMAYTALEPICMSANRRSRVIGYLIENEGLESLAKQSKWLTEHIKKYNPDIRALRSRSEIIARFKWAFQKKEIDALGLRMESIKSNLQIVMSSVTLEALIEQPPSTAKDRLIELLNRQIRVHVRTIGILQGQLEKHSLHPTLETERPHAVVDLGLSMADNGTVPRSMPSPASSSSSLMSMRHQPNINDQGCPSTRLHYSTTSISTSPSQGFSSTSFERQDLQSIDNGQQSQERHHSTTSKSVLVSTREGLHPQRQISQSVEITRMSQPLDPTSENQPCPTDIEIDITASQHIPSAQGNFISVYENSYLLNLNPSHQFLAESGYIATPIGPVSTTALVDSDFGANLISQSYAVRLGLEIEELDANEQESDGVWIDFGDGQRQRAVGKLCLKWNNGLLPSKVSFSVHCWVCEHNVRNVVFGKPFIEKRNHYWHRGSN